MEILAKIGAFVASAALAVSSFFGFPPPAEPQPETTYGASLPAVAAVFETSLAAPISSSATSMTLTANSVRGGGTLSGYTCFTIDEGTSQAEFVCGTVSGTSVTSLSRGVSPSTGTTTIASLQFAHRRGASVKITDFPVIQIVKAQNAGQDTFPAALIYDSGVGTTSSSFPTSYHLVNRGYVDAAVLNVAGVVTASETAAGFVEIATGLEAASSTTNGSVSRLVLPASVATSTYNSATAASRVVVTGLDGKIDSNFVNIGNLATTTFSGFVSFSGVATSTIASSSIVAFTSSTTPTTTWTKPANLKYILVKVVGKGGAGAAGVNNGTTDDGGGGGGAGGYGEEIIPAAALGATETITVSGTVGISSSFGSHCSATSGTNASATIGGIGGSGSGCDINLTGQDGQSADSGDNAPGGNGGSSQMGGGGRGGNDSGEDGGTYGGGGGGGGINGAGGGGGAVGAVFVYQYFF